MDIFIWGRKVCLPLGKAEPLFRPIKISIFFKQNKNQALSSHSNKNEKQIGIHEAAEPHPVRDCVPSDQAFGKTSNVIRSDLLSKSQNLHYRFTRPTSNRKKSLSDKKKGSESKKILSGTLI